MINVERLSRYFLELAHIESPSRREGQIASYLREKFESLGARCLFDDSASKTGSEVGNLIVKFPKDSERALVFLAGHMDTVEPTKDPKIIFENGIFRSDGRTVCGADDKSALAIFLEITHLLREQGLYLPIEFIITTCEEIGLLGAKNLDYRLVSAPFGYALDSEDPDELINRAPEAIRFELKVLGLAAHAGLNPEAGINAITLAGKALAKVRVGRIDPETTANIGVIQGGVATNIVPEEVKLLGEVRSHQHEKLEAQWEHIYQTFKETIDAERAPGENRPELLVSKIQDYPLMQVKEDHPVVKIAQEAARRLGRQLHLTSTGGGSDANIFNGQGLTCVILGTGMRRVHSTEEYLPLKDLVKACELSLQILLEAGGVAG